MRYTFPYLHLCENKLRIYMTKLINTRWSHTKCTLTCKPHVLLWCGTDNN